MEKDGRGKRPEQEYTPLKEQGGGQRESEERQPLPNVWDVLERRVKAWMPDPKRTYGERIDAYNEVDLLIDGLREKGTDRDRLILDLYSSITIQPGPSERIVRELFLPEEFPEFRSKLEPMSDDEIREEIRKEEEEKQRKIEESRKTNRPLTLDPPKPLWEPPDPATGCFC